MKKVKNGSQSNLGYYSEFITARAILNNLNDNGLDIHLNSLRDDPLKMIDDKISLYEEEKLYGVSISEINRQHESGVAMGNQIYKDCVSHDDLSSLIFNVILTGDSLKGQNKADVVVEIKNKVTDEKVDNIMASLKAYKGWNVNLANNTLISLFDNLGVELNGQDKERMKHLQNVRANIFKHWKSDDIDYIVADYGIDVANAVFPLFKTKFQKSIKVTDEQKALIKAGHDVIQKDITEMFVLLFKKAYSSNKEKMNNGFLELMGFDGSDDFYLAVKQRGAVKVLSNRHSEQYANMISSLQNDFSIALKYNEDTPSIIYLTFYDENNNLILKSNFSIGQTSRTGSSRTNLWVDFSPFSVDAV